jgi:predicted ester cyclase
MKANDNSAVARRITFDLFQSGNVALLDELTTPDFRNEGQTAGPNEGRANLSNAIARVRGAFPDLEYTLEHEVADGDVVVHHLRARGTHRGQLGPYAPTAKSAAWREMHLMRFRDGRMTEQWGVVDRLGILQQLGLI